MDNQQYPNQQNQYQQNQYQQPMYQQNNANMYPQYDNTNKVLSVGEYIGMFILSAIPVVNIICWIVWLLGSNVNKNKRNYVIAQIVMTIIIWLIVIVFGVLVSAGVITGIDEIASNL